MDQFDVVVLGGGPAGERAAIQAAKLGKRVAVVERHHVVGGTGVNWGAIPSKTLRESAQFVRSLTDRKLDGVPVEIKGQLTVTDVMFRERVVVQRELELINEALDRHAVEIVSGHGRFADPHTVTVRGLAGEEERRLHADIFVIAVGSRPNHPADVPFDGEVVFDSTSILKLPRLPRSLIVLGAGVVGVEYASIFAALGVQVTLVDTRPRMLPFVDAEVIDILQRELVRLGLVILQGDHYQRVEPRPGGASAVVVHTRRGTRLEAEALLYCVGRDGNTDDLGLERLGIAPDARGLLSVNEHFQTALSHIYAVGDVIGYPALASTSMEQGRQAVRHAYGAPGPRGNTTLLPFAIYAIPEVSYIGPSEEELETAGVDYVVGRGRYALNPRGQILGDTGGLLKLLFARESLQLRAVHIVGTNASELVHVGQAFLYGGATAHDIAETLYNYPTLSDLYRHAALHGLITARALPATTRP